MSGPGGETHYELLGIDGDATAEDVRRAFRALAKTAHPDVGGDTEHFRRLRLAHDTLVSPILRRAYDKELGLDWMRAPTVARPASGAGAWTGTQGDFTGDVEFPAYLRDVTDAPWRPTVVPGEGSGGGAPDDAASLPTRLEPATVAWWWTGVAAFDPVVVGGMAIVAAGQDVVALEVFGGSEVWRTRLPAPVAGAPFAVAGHVVAADASHGIHVLEVGSGQVLWRHDPRVPVVGPVAAGRSVAIAVEGRVTALDPARGRTAWTARLVGDVESLHGVGEVVVATTRRRSLEAIDAANGRHRWVHRPVTTPRMAPIWATGAIWLVASGGRLVSLDATTGDTLAPRAPGLAVVALVGDDRRLLVSATGPPAVVSLDHLGRTQWQARLRQAVPLPAVDGDAVHVVDPTGRLIGLDLASGRVRGAAQLGIEPAGAPVAAGGRVLVTDRSGTIWAHEAPVGLP